MRVASRLVVLVCLLILVPGAFAQYTFWVSPEGSGNLSGSDSTNTIPGLQRAFSTIKHTSGIPGEATVEVMVLPGTYHMSEDSCLTYTGWDLPYMVLRGYGSERPVITGLKSEPIQGWVHMGLDYWEAPWPHNFGFMANPDSMLCGEDGFEGWIGCLLEHFHPSLDNQLWRDGRTILRREMLFQNGERLRQVGNMEALWLRANSFTVPMHGPGMVRIKTNDNPNDVPVYMADCEQLLAVRNSRGVELHNLEFTQGNPFIKTGMVEITNTPQVTIRDCEFSYSNAVGLYVSRAPCYPIDPYDPDSWVVMEEKRAPWNTIDNVYAHHCGIYGLFVAHAQAFSVTNLRLERNNWRGYEAGTVAYDAGATKFFRTRHMVIDNLLSQFNFGHGLWFDKDGRDLIVRNSRMQFNSYRGIFVERSFGPVLIEHCVMTQNTRDMDDDRIYRFRSSALGMSACDTMVVRNTQLLSQRGYPVLIHSIDYVMEDGIMEPYSDTLYTQAWNNRYQDCTFSRPNGDDFYFFYFGVAPQMSRCYYMYHTELEHNTWIVDGQEIPKYFVISESNRRCQPIYDGFEYDLRKWYDTPWDDDPPEGEQYKRRRHGGGGP